jgi:Rho termination factor, N-terminal domain
LRARAESPVPTPAWTVPELKKRAKELGMSGYSGLKKDKLIAKLRNH